MYATIRTGLMAAALTSVAVAAAQAEDEKILNVYNWSDYIAEDTIPDFQEETGIEVRYDVFDSNEVLEGKLLAGNTGYDIVVPSASFMARQIQAGVFMELDKSKLDGLDNLNASIMEKVAQYDPGNKHGVPYMWGTTGFAYNIGMIEERMPDAPVNSWDMMFDPDVVSKFADCGVTFLDAPTEVFDAARNYLGIDPDSEDPEHLKKAEDLLMKVRPYIKYFHSSQNINDLANGDICLAMGWSGDMFIARDRAAEAGQGVEIDYVIPKEGAVIWFDMMAIPADAPHPDNAHKWIDYILEPKTAAEITNYVWYANPNDASEEYVDDEILNDPAIYPPDEVLDRLFAALPNSPKFDRIQTRAWTRVKTGQ